MNPKFEYGLCQCGCGGKTSLARYTYAKGQMQRGEPVRFLVGHGRRKPGPDYVENADGCWIWQRARCKRPPYGLVWDPRTKTRTLAHRVYYIQAKGPIPDGLHLDHLCGVPQCVNPDHLEPVTRRENAQRGRNAKLNWPIVNRLRKEWANSGCSATTFAKAEAANYGVSWYCIHEMLIERTWQDPSVQT